MTDMTAAELEALAQRVKDAIGVRDMDDALAALGVAVCDCFNQIEPSQRDTAAVAWIVTLMRAIHSERVH